MTRWVLASLFLSTVASAAPVQLTHQGRLLDVNGEPISGENTIVVRLYDAVDSESALFTQTVTTTLSEGYYAVQLDTNDDDDAPLDSALFDGGPRFVSVGIGDDELSGRSRLTTTPYAAHAAVASGVAVSSAAGDCDDGELRYNAATEALEVCADNAWTATGGTSGLQSGTYENATITVDAQGRITQVASGAPSGAGIDTRVVTSTTLNSWRTVSCPSNYTLSGCTCRYLSDTTTFYDGFCEVNNSTSCRGKGYYGSPWTFQVQAVCIRVL